MPDFKDLAALPTSWALTLWDAVPIILSLELALAILAALVRSEKHRIRFWIFATSSSISGVAYAAMFNSPLALVMTLAIAVHAAGDFIARSKPEPYTVPETPLQAVKLRFETIAWPTAIACLVAASIKTLVVPSLDTYSPGWVAIAIVGGLSTPIPIGLAAIPALSIQTATGSVIPTAIWIAAAVIRYRVVQFFHRSR